MVERSQNSYPLLRQFREFYAEVARLRAIVERAGSAGEWESSAGWICRGCIGRIADRRGAGRHSIVVGLDRPG